VATQTIDVTDDGLEFQRRQLAVRLPDQSGADVADDQLVRGDYEFSSFFRGNPAKKVAERLVIECRSETEDLVVAGGDRRDAEHARCKRCGTGRDDKAAGDGHGEISNGI
jgi:hypothetical protein